MTRASWSISRRIALRTALLATGLAVAVSAIGAFYLQRSIGRELDALVREEVEEMLGRFRARPLGELPAGEIDEEFRAAAEKAVVDFSHDHPDIAMAWRLVDLRDRSTFWQVGATELFSDPRELSGQLDVTRELTNALRWRLQRVGGTSATSSPLAIGLLLDGSKRLALIRQYGTVVLVLVVVAALLSILGGGLFGLRLARDLRRVADSVRAAGDPTLGDAPSELRDVVDALGETLQRIRGEQDRAKLLVAGLAHELRSPIQNLLGETEVALMRQRAPDEYRALLESNVEEFRDLARVVDNLVSLCASAGSDAGGVERFDLGEELALRLARERARAERRRVALALESGGDLRMRGDREAVFLAIGNLIGNAIDWSPPAGRVEVGLRGEPASIEITVDDSGPGVAPGEEERIFEPFYRGSQKNGRRVGFGLGLALTRKAVEAHGGSIRVARSPLGGARFQVSLPRREAIEPAPERDGASGGDRSHGAHERASI